MKQLSVIIIILISMVRPALPVINYAVNYDYIVENLCEQRFNPNNTCHGKCQLRKEFAKTDKEQGKTENLKLNFPGTDFFLVNGYSFLIDTAAFTPLEKRVQSPVVTFSLKDFFTDIFRPPIV